MKKFHELTHSDHSDEYHGFGFPNPQDVLSRDQLDQLIDQRIQSHSADYHAGVRSQARKYVDVEDSMQQIRFSRQRTPYWFVTINPKPQITLELFHNTIVTMLSNEHISFPQWSYEIRQSPDQGLHAHIFFKCETQDKNFAQRKVKALFVPSICANTKHVHVRWVTESEVDATLSYINKKDVAKSKKKSHQATLTWRENQGIPDVLNEDHLLVWSSLSQPEQIQPPDPLSDLEDEILEDSYTDEDDKDNIISLF